MESKKNNSQIEGVSIYPLNRIPDERGTIFHMMRCDDDNFKEFGEIYFKRCMPQAISGWHIHKSLILNYAVPIGWLKLVLCDLRTKSPTYKMIQEIFMGEDNYILVTVPPGVANGFKAYGSYPAFLANCATEAHSSNEMTRLDPFDSKIPYDWSLKNR